MKKLKIIRIFVFLSLIATLFSCSKQVIKGGMICRYEQERNGSIDEIMFINDSCYLQKWKYFDSYTDKYLYGLSVGHYYLDTKNVIKLRADYLCKYLPVFFMEESYREENDSLKIITFDFTNLQGEKPNLELISHYIYINDDITNKYYINKKGRLWSFTADTSVDSSYQHIRKMDMKINKILFTSLSPPVEYHCKTKNANHFSIMTPDTDFNPIFFIGYTDESDKYLYKLKNRNVYFYIGKLEKSRNILKFIRNWIDYKKYSISKYDWVDSSKISLEEMGAKELIRRWDMKLLEPNSHK